MRRDDHRLAAPRAPAQLRGELRLGGAVHPAGGLVESEHRGIPRPLEILFPVVVAAPVTIASARRWRSPPERSRGLRSASSSRPTAASASARRLAVDALVHEVVAGVLQQQGDPPGPLDPPASGLQQAGRVAQQRGLAGAVAAHQRDALPRGQPQARAAQDRGSPAQLVPHAAQLQRRRARGATASEARDAARRRGSRGCWVDGCGSATPGGRLLGQQAMPAQRRARLLDADRRGAETRQREQLRARGLQRGGARRGPLQERARVAVVGDAPAVQRDHPIGGTQAALQAVLGEQDRRLPLLVEAAQQPDQLVAGDGVELRGRLVEQQHPRAARERGAERDALLLAARELVRGAIEQVVDAERERDLLDPARHRGGAVPAALQRERELGAHRVHHELRLGILEERPRDRPQPRGAVLAGVEAREHDTPREAPAVEVRHQAAGGAQQRGLAVAGEARQQAQLARGNLQAHVVERRALDARVAVGDAVERQDAHGSIPRRSQNGSSTAAGRATHSASSAGAERHVQQRVGAEGGRTGESSQQRQREHRDGGRREREIVARPRPPQAADRRSAGPAREAGGGREAADLQRRRDVHRPVQRAARPPRRAGPRGRAALVAGRRGGCAGPRPGAACRRRAPGSCASRATR